MGGHQTIDVRLSPAHAGWRLDRALADAVPTLSRERLKALIRSGALSDGAVRDPATKVKGDEAWLKGHFDTQGWIFMGPSEVKSELCAFRDSGYENSVAAVVAKILLRG